MELEEAVPEAESLFPTVSQNTEVGADGGESHEREEADVVKQDKDPVGEGKDEETGGGLLDRLMSNLVSPLSPKAGEINEVKSEENDDRNKGYQPEEEASGGEGGGRLVTNIISNFFHQSEGEIKENEEKKEEERVKDVAEEDEKLKAKEDSEEGLIDNIVSHLPISLPKAGAVAPTSDDEAAILIHSIIHD
ncbi:hypothetical protein SLE2022_105830 [Rubroshorea leprosula]